MSWAAANRAAQGLKGAVIPCLYGRDRGRRDAAVRALFERELGAGPSVSFDAPTAAWAEALSRPALNLYLYDVKESRSERRVEWDQARVNGRTVERPPPVRIDVSYVITAWAKTAEEEHGLLSAAL